MNPGPLQIEPIQAGLRTKRIGRAIVYIETTTSTNDEAWRHIDDDEADGLAVLAEYQTAGRGRLGRAWRSPRGASLLLSVLVIDNRAELDGGELGLLTAVAACDAIRARTDVIAMIKWPNDLVVCQRKLGGILIESRVRDDRSRAYTIGIGINCLQHRGHFDVELADAATSLEIESTGAVDREALAGSLLTELDRWLAEPAAWSEDDLRDSWLARAEPMGGRVCLQQGGIVFSGSVIDVDPSAALVVQLDEGGVRAFDAASTTVVPPAQGTGD